MNLRGPKHSLHSIEHTLNLKFIQHDHQKPSISYIENMCNHNSAMSRNGLQPSREAGYPFRHL